MGDDAVERVDLVQERLNQSCEKCRGGGQEVPETRWVRVDILQMKNTVISSMSGNGE